MSLALYAVDGNVATVTMNRADRLNAMNIELIMDVRAALLDAQADDRVRVVIFTGAGKGFCPGGDLQGLQGGSVSGDLTVNERIANMTILTETSLLLRTMPKVTIAAINGACAGAGLSWAAACDLRYASATASFNTAFINAGQTADYGGTWLLPRLLGDAKARELFFLGEKFDGIDAERMGLVTKAVPGEQLMEHVGKIAQSIASKAPLAIRGIKNNLNDADRLNFGELLKLEGERLIRNTQTADSKEAAKAFLEKRTPVFHGR
ncbi:MAG: enoyl-CoA hydratase/isomerase family protein [Acidimicrobiia bacterium]